MTDKRAGWSARTEQHAGAGPTRTYLSGTGGLQGGGKSVVKELAHLGLVHEHNEGDVAHSVERERLVKVAIAEMDVCMLELRVHGQLVPYDAVHGL